MRSLWEKSAAECVSAYFKARLVRSEQPFKSKWFDIGKRKPSWELSAKWGN